jgi:hypothetical protein
MIPGLITVGSNASAVMAPAKPLGAYFSEELIEVNLAFRFVPSPLTATMIAMEIPAAMSPYSMAVAPLSSLKKRAIRLLISSSQK